MTSTNSAAWLIPARLKAKYLRSQANSTNAMVRNLQEEAVDIAAAIGRLETRRAELLDQRTHASGIADAHCKSDRITQIDNLLQSVELELELLAQGRNDLTQKQQAAQEIAVRTIRTAEGAERVIQHINGVQMPGLVVSGGAL